MLLSATLPETVESICCASKPASTSDSLLWVDIVLCQRLFLLLLCTYKMPGTYQACFPVRKENAGQLSRYSELGYGLDGLGFVSWQGQNVIFSSKRPYRLWSPPSLLFNGHWGSFPGVERSGLEGGHSLPSSAEVRNLWRYVSDPLCTAII